MQHQPKIPKWVNEYAYPEWFPGLGEGIALVASVAPLLIIFLVSIPLSIISELAGTPVPAIANKLVCYLSEAMLLPFLAMLFVAIRRIPGTALLKLAAVVWLRRAWRDATGVPFEKNRDKMFDALGDIARKVAGADADLWCERFYQARDAASLLGLCEGDERVRDFRRPGRQ